MHLIMAADWILFPTTDAQTHNYFCLPVATIPAPAKMHCLKEQDNTEGSDTCHTWDVGNFNVQLKEKNLKFC